MAAAHPMANTFWTSDTGNELRFALIVQTGNDVEECRDEKDAIAMCDTGPSTINAMFLRQKPGGTVAGAVRFGCAVLI